MSDIIRLIPTTEDHRAYIEGSANDEQIQRIKKYEEILEAYLNGTLDAVTEALYLKEAKEEEKIAVSKLGIGRDELRAKARKSKEGIIKELFQPVEEVSTTS